MKTIPIITIKAVIALYDGFEILSILYRKRHNYAWYGWYFFIWSVIHKDAPWYNCCGKVGHTSYCKCEKDTPISPWFVPLVSNLEGPDCIYIKA